MRQQIVIVGGGLAAYAVSTALRKADAEIGITIVTDEHHAPYDRPPLSKAVMQSDDAAVPYLLAPEAYSERGIELLTGRRATQIDRAGRRLLLSDGNALSYDRLILATGGRSRRLDVPGSENILYLRNYDDAVEIRQRLRPGSTLVCIGAGVVCLELAAVAVQMGVNVHVVEMGDTVMARMLPAPERAYFRHLHESHGVAFHFGAVPERVEASEEHISVQLAGRTIAADTVVAGIGMVPNAELAAEAGLDMGRGVHVDSYGRTSDPAIFALGDVAEFYHPVVNQRMMLEAWYNAMEQAAAIAKTITAEPTEHAPVPRFWTDQFGRNFQMVGDFGSATRFIVEGEREAGKFAVIYLDDSDKVVFALAADDPRRARAALKSIQTGAVYDGAASAKSLAGLQPA